MRTLILCIIVLVSSLGFPARAEESDDLPHAAAHIGISYAITHAVHVACRKLTSASKPTCTVIGAGTALATGAVKEAIDAKNGSSVKRNLEGLMQDTTGIGLAVFVISVDF